ncbi:TMV resistance protein N-like [Dorcoceras hygrometricum]|uniref:TMV resistance protein N-like n=1 Tax=Dorcoceras hygrometricum TaxID=472368 RepID=A0A2Z7BAC8_9LAMI|nr:TMV resistance protein N-like [Dorcoceras hygrometricum]
MMRRRAGESADGLVLMMSSVTSSYSADGLRDQSQESAVTQLRLFVHLRSLGVLIAAGCGIGSVHAVVRSNLLVEPSEVEEGEISVSGALHRVTFMCSRTTSYCSSRGYISSAQNFRKPFKRALAADLLVILILYGPTSGIRAGSFDAITQEKFLIMAAITCGVKINWNNLLFNILKDMVTPGSRQAKGYAIQISILLENVPSLELGESSEFHSSKILTEKTVHRYVVLNDKVGMEDVTDEPRVKKPSVRKAASKKIPAVTTAAKPVVKKKRTIKSKSGSSKEKLEILSVAQEAVPLQIIDPTPDAPTEKSPVPKRKIQKRRRRLVLGFDDDIVEKPAAEVASETTVGEPAVEVAGETVVEESAVANVLEEQQRETFVDDFVAVPDETVVENIAEPISEPAVADVANAGMSTADDVDIIIGQVLAETAQIVPDEEEQDVGGLDVAGTAEFHARLDVDRPIETASDTDEDMETVEEMETEAVEQSVDEAMSLKDIFMTIPVECPLPSANVEITKIILGKSISIPGVDEWDWKFLEARKINFVLGEGSSATDLKILEIISNLHMFVVEDLKEQTMANSLRWEKTCCSKNFEGCPRYRVEDDSAPDQFISTSSTTAISDSIDALRESFSNLVANQSRDSRKTNTALSEVMCKIDHVQRVFLDCLAEQNETFRGLFKRSRQEAQNDNNALPLALKAVRTQNVILSTDLEATRKEVKDFKATLSKDFDDKLADIRNELLEFHVYTQGQLASLGTHLAELIDFLTKAVMIKRGKIVAAAALNHLLKIKADPTGEVVAVAIEQMNRAVLLEVVAEVKVREEETVVVPQKEGDQVRLKIYSYQFLVSGFYVSRESKSDVDHLKRQCSNKLKRQRKASAKILSLEVALLIQQMATVKYQQTVVYFNSQRKSADGYSILLIQSMLLLTVVTSSKEDTYSYLQLHIFQRLHNRSLDSNCKKKRTMKKKSGSSKVNLEIVAVPIQMVEPTTAAPAAEDSFTQPAAEDEIPADPPADEVVSVTVDEVAADAGANEETADDDAARVNEPTFEPAVADIVNEEPSTADDVDVIIDQVLADTAQISVDEEDQVVCTSGEGNQPAGTTEEIHWFDLPYDDLISRWDATVVTASDIDEEV